MKRTGLIAMIIAMVCVLLVGCAGKSEQASVSKKDIQVEPQKLADYIVKNTEFKDYMNTVDQEVFLSLYNLDSSVVEKAVLYASTGATAEEVAVIKPKDSKGMETIQKACEQRIEAQKQAFENYVPGELTKLNTPIMEQVGDTFVLVVCDDSEKAQKIIEQYSGQEV